MRASAERRRRRKEKDDKTTKKEEEDKEEEEDEEEEEEDTFTKLPQHIKKTTCISRLHRGLQGTPWRTKTKMNIVSPHKSVSTASPSALVKSGEGGFSTPAKRDNTCILSLLEECQDDAESVKSGKAY